MDQFLKTHPIINNIMRILLYFTLLTFFININLAYSQQKITPGEFKIKKSIFKVEKVPNTTTYIISNLNDDYTDENDPNFLFIDRELVNKDLIMELVLKALGSKGDVIKNNDELIVLSCLFLPNGKIKALSYVINFETKLSVQDIEVIDSKLKKCFIGKIKSTQDLHLRLKTIPFTQELIFSPIKDRFTKAYHGVGYSICRSLNSFSFSNR